MTVNYRITYTDAIDVSRTIDLLPGDDGVRIDWRTELNRNTSSTGIYETIVQNTLRFVSFDCYFQEAAFHKLETWISFAQEGYSFSFSKDSTRSPIKTLTAPNAGDSEYYSVDDATVFVPGDTIIVYDDFLTKWDVTTVDSAITTTITAIETSQHAYAIGDNVSWYYYYPALLLLDETFNPDRDGSFWHHTFNCVEVRNVS